MCIVLCSSPSLCPAFLWQRRNCFIDHLLEPLGSELFFFFIIIIFLFCRECEKSFSSLSYFFFSLLPLCLQKKNKLQITTFFCTYACKLIKILEPSFGDWGGQGTVRRKKKMKKKPYISVSSSDGLDAYRVILVTYISAAYITEQLKRNNGVTFAPCFLVVFMCGTKV